MNVLLKPSKSEVMFGFSDSIRICFSNRDKMLGEIFGKLYIPRQD